MRKIILLLIILSFMLTACSGVKPPPNPCGVSSRFETNPVLESITGLFGDISIHPGVPDMAEYAINSVESYKRNYKIDLIGLKHDMNEEIAKHKNSIDSYNTLIALG